MLGPRLGLGPIPGVLTAELLLNARRIAFLTRIRVLAAAANDAAVQARVDEILARETVRHEARVAVLAVPTPGVPTGFPNGGLGLTSLPDPFLGQIPGATATIGIPVPPSAVLTVAPATAAGAQ